MWIWSRASDWWIGVDLRLIWLLELQIYTQFGVRLRRNRALRSQCTIQSQSATLTGLSLTRCLVNSVLATESRTPAHSFAVVIAFAVVHLYLHLPLWCCCQIVHIELFIDERVDRLIDLCRVLMVDWPGAPGALWRDLQCTCPVHVTRARAPRLANTDYLTDLHLYMTLSP